MPNIIFIKWIFNKYWILNWRPNSFLIPVEKYDVNPSILKQYYKLYHIFVNIFHKFYQIKIPYKIFIIFIWLSYNWITAFLLFAILMLIIFKSSYGFSGALLLKLLLESVFLLENYFHFWNYFPYSIIYLL